MKRLLTLLTIVVVLMAFASCKSEKSVGENPFFTQWDTPFGVPPFDKIAEEHYMPAFERAMSVYDAEIEAITSREDAPSFENVILAYDTSGQMLSQVKAVFGMISAADTNDQLQAIQEQVAPMLAAHGDKILLNQTLFAKVKAVYDQRANLSLDAEQGRLLEKIYNSFVRSGALLDGQKMERLKQINEELSLAGVKFGNNILAQNNGFALELTSDDLDGLPTSVREAAREAAEKKKMTNKWLFTLHKPSMLPFLTYSTRRDLRQKIYTAYLMRGNNDDEFDNKQLINDFVRLRTEKAHLLGYPSYAAYVVANEMAKTPEAVYGLLDQVFEPALERAKSELAQLDVLLQQDLPGAKFESWDWWYYAERVRKNNYSLDEEVLRPYFALENVQDGIFFLANRLFGLTFRPVVVPVYNSEVSAYEVLDADQTNLGLLYFDYFPREGKGQGAWCGNYVDQTYKDGKRVPPVLSIVCNFTRPTRSGPALLSLDETETLFHEFGHALHFIFHDVKYRGLTNVEGDFVELPSQIMENWAFEPQMLKHYAVNSRSGEVISDYLIDKLRKAELFNQGFVTTEMVGAALLDMDIHSTTNYEPFDVNQFETKSLATKRGMIPQIASRYRLPYFSHIFDGGYSAGYYFYTWAEVLDKDAFEAFRESGDLYNRKIAADFRTKILARGGSEDGMTMYRAFRGAEPDKRAMLLGRGLISEPIAEIDAQVENTNATLQN